MPKKNSDTISNLKEEWKYFSRINKTTQIEASRQMGWSDSFFGSILRGDSNLSLENLIKISNFLKIAPHRINPEHRNSNITSYTIHETTSGKNPPAPVRNFAFGTINIWADKAVPVFAESENKSHRIQYFSKGLTLVCSAKDFPSVDDNFLNIITPYWLVLQPNKETICITSKAKPNIQGAKVLRVIGLHMV